MVRFTYELNDHVNSEYVVYRDGEAFCHLSERDLDIFIDVVRSSSLATIFHVMDQYEDPMGDGAMPSRWP